METSLQKWLAASGATWKEQPIQLAKIDRGKSLHNQARVGQPLNDDVVLLYAYAMENGEEFPPIVVYPNGSGTYIVVDGNHRVESADLAKREVLPAVIITNATGPMIQSLTYEANTKHGLPTALGERIQQALHLIASGMSLKDAALSLGVPENRVKQAHMIQRTDVRLYRLRREAAGKVPLAVKRRMDSIKSDRVLAALTDLVLNAGLTGDEAGDLVTLINQQREEEEQMLVITREVGRRAARVAATAGGKMTLPKSLSQLEQAVAAVERVDMEQVAKDFVIVGEGMKMVLLAKVMDAHKRLRELLK